MQLNESSLTVLLLTTEYSQSIIGGLGRHVSDLAEEGNRNGVTFIVITPSLTTGDAYTIENGNHVFRLSPIHQKSGSFFEYILNINYRFIQFVLNELELPFDLIHVHDWLTGISGIELKQFLNKPLLATIHATENGRKQGVINKTSNRITSYEERLIQKADRIIVCSHYMKSELEREFAFPNEKTYVIYNGIIPANYKIRVGNTMNSSIHPPYILGIGRLVKEKGFQYLLHSFAELLIDFPNYRLILAGNGPYEEELMELTKELAIENRVVFTGFIRDLDRNNLLNYCELLVVPSLYEPFGLVALEGMSVRKPVMAFKVGGLAELLAEKRGILVEEISSISLANEIRKFILAPKRYTEISYGGFQAANTIFNLSILIKETVEVYKEVNNIYRSSNES